MKSSASVQLPLFVTLKKVYDRNVVNKYLLFGVIIYNLIDYNIYIYISRSYFETSHVNVVDRLAFQPNNNII